MDSSETCTGILTEVKARGYIKREVIKPVIFSNRGWIGGPVDQRKKRVKWISIFSQVSVQGLVYKDEFCNPKKAAKWEICLWSKKYVVKWPQMQLLKLIFREKSCHTQIQEILMTAKIIWTFIYSYIIHFLETRKWDDTLFGKGLKQILRHRVVNSIAGNRLAWDSLYLVLPEAGTHTAAFTLFSCSCLLQRHRFFPSLFQVSTGWRIESLKLAPNVLLCY